MTRSALQACMLTAAALAVAALLPVPAHATNGYFSHGYGAKSQALGGAGIALPQDSLAAATNPAGTGAAGDRVDLGLDWFAPRRSASITGNGFGADASYSGDNQKNFFLPELGYARRLSDRLAVGVAVYGNGGLNTSYTTNPYSRFGGNGAAGVNLEQLFITPSLAFKVGESQSIGVALNLAYQRFSAKGISVFDAFSAAPGQVSDQGNDSSTGAGLRLGWSGEVAPGLTLGATWASKVGGRFDKYRGLFADGGSFDIPENYGVGLAWAVAPDWRLAADLQTIRYSQVAAVGDPAASLFAGRPLGSTDGPGFGWRDITVAKLGAEVRLSNTLTWRAGFSHARQPVPASETFFNVLAPGVVQDHVTTGATWTVGGGELSGFFAYAPRKTVNGNNSIPPGNPPQGLGGGNANVRLQETILGISYGWKL